MDEAKCELIRAWLVKARSDLGTARKLAAGPERFPDTAVYHCQQAAEKAIKAFLVFHDHRSPKSHDIRLLIQESTPFDPALTELEDAGDVLTPLATAYRYPGEILQPDWEEVEQALVRAAEIFEFILARLPAACHPQLITG